MKKILLTVVGVAVLAGAVGFFGGMKYAQMSRASQFAGRLGGQQGNMAGVGGRLQGGRGGLSNGGFTSGDIISKDDKSITVKMRDGGSKIIFYSGSTEVGKFVNGTATDLQVGKSVSINGTSNQDGSITAQSIQLRPNLPSPTATPAK